MMIKILLRFVHNGFNIIFAFIKLFFFWEIIKNLWNKWINQNSWSMSRMEWNYLPHSNLWQHIASHKSWNIPRTSLCIPPFLILFGVFLIIFSIQEVCRDLKFCISWPLSLVFRFEINDFNFWFKILTYSSSVFLFFTKYVKELKFSKIS